MNWSKNIKISCFNEHSGSSLLTCNCGITQTHAGICFTVALGSVLAGCCAQVPRALVLREDLKSIFLLSSCFSLFQNMAGKSTEFGRTHILRDAPRSRGGQLHWVDHKEKLDGVLFFHSISLRDILQGQARPEKCVLFPNGVTVIPTCVKLRRPIYEGQPIPEQWRGKAERGPMEPKSGCRTSSNRTRRACEACCTDRRFCDRTYQYGTYFPKFLGIARNVPSYSGEYGRNKFLQELCM